MGKKDQTRHVAVAIIYDSDTKRVLMITSRKHPALWILPKGGIDDGEISGQAAVRESWEEAGTPSDLRIPTDEERLMMIALEPGTSKRSSVWHIHVVRTSEAAVAAVTDWHDLGVENIRPERHERQRQWFTARDALARISEWYADPSAVQEGSGGEILEETRSSSRKEEKKQHKKGLKGGAMETAFRAFMEGEGFDASQRQGI